MQYHVDSYILEYKEDEDKCYISFLDSVENECKLEIDKDIFDIYLSSKKAYVKIKNETSRHLEHLALTDEELYKRALGENSSVEDEVIKNMNQENLKKALNNLTETQYKRIELHIVNEVSIRDLAKIENVQKSQIQKSLKLGMKKLKNFFEN